MSSNPDSLPAPAVPNWLNSEFVEKQLRDHYKNDEIQVVDFAVKSPSRDLGNFASKIYKAKISFKVSSKSETTTVNVIVKEGITEGLSHKIFSEFDIYVKEMEFYDKIVPKFNEKLQLLDEPSLFAKVFGVCKQRNLLILEDLSHLGYKTRPGAYELDATETKAILNRVAVFHAICAVLQQENADIFARFTTGHLSRVPEGFKNVYITHMDIVIEIISEWDGFGVYAEKLRRIRNDVMERGHQTYDENPNHFNTLVHDDLWNTNIMINNGNSSGNEPFDKIMLIDFQFSFWSSPTVELHYFLNSSVHDDLRPNHFDEFVRFYHEQLVKFLKQLNYKKHIPTWTEFYAQYQDRMFFGFIVSCLVQPLLINNTENVDAEALISLNENGINSKRSLYKSDRIRANLRKLIPYYDQLGIFD